MAYSAASPPRLVVPGLAGGPAIWTYKSTDPSTGVAAASYFANGYDLGMKVDDVLISTVTSSGLAIGTVSSVTTSSGATVVFGNMVST